MKPLKNNRHEKFALAIFKGMSQTAAAIEAGYKPSRARYTASRLATYGNIRKRIEELNEKATSPAILSVKERKERLTELAQKDIKQPVTAKEVIFSIAELNKMGGDYPPSEVKVDPGEELKPILQGILSQLRGYPKKD